MKILSAFVLLFLSVIAYAAVEPKASQKLQLKIGWNLVTIVKPLADANQNIEKFLALYPYTIDTATNSYVRCTTKDDIKVGIGYWIYVSDLSQTTSELVLDVTQNSWITTDATASWNLLGYAEKSSWQSKIPQIWQWQDGRFQLINSSELPYGYACWGYLPDDK